MAGECAVCGRALPGHKVGGKSCKALGYDRLLAALAAAEAREAEMRIREGDMFFEATRRMLESNELRDKLAAAEGREAALREEVLRLAKAFADEASKYEQGRNASGAAQLRRVSSLLYVIGYNGKGAKFTPVPTTCDRTTPASPGAQGGSRELECGSDFLDDLRAIEERRAIAPRDHAAHSEYHATNHAPAQDKDRFRDGLEVAAKWHEEWADRCAKLAIKEHSDGHYFNATSCEGYVRLHQEAADEIRKLAN